MSKTNTILVVDDDRQQLDMLTSYLENHYFKTVSAENGMQGIEKLAESSIDLIVSDVQMPGMNGLEFHEAIRSKGYEQPILFITAFRKL